MAGLAPGATRHTKSIRQRRSCLHPRARGLRRACTIAALLVALAILVPRHALAYTKSSITSTDFFDSVGYLEPNPDAPKPSLPRYGTGTDDVISAPGWSWDTTIRSGGIWVYDGAGAKNNAATGATIQIRYPEAGWLRQGNQRTSGLLDIYVTFTALYTGSATSSGKVCWGPNGQSGSLVKDGFWVQNAMVYKTVYTFCDHETGEPLTFDSMAYTERSMNTGEGFMVKDARIGYTSNDLPSSILGRNARGVAWAKGDSLTGTTLNELHLSTDTTYQGFVGGIPQTVRSGVRVSENNGNASAANLFINSNNAAVTDGRTDVQYIQGSDASDVIRTKILIDGSDVFFPDTSMWMGASVEAPAGSSVEVVGVALMRYGLGRRTSAWTIDAGDSGTLGIASTVFGQARGFDEAYRSVTGSYSIYGAHAGAEPENTESYRWYVPQFYVFTAVKPTEPTKAVDKEQASPGETLTYTIRQQVNNVGYDTWPSYRYSSLRFADTLPDGLAYQGDLHVYYSATEEGATTDVTSNGQVQASGQQLAWAAGEEWLRGGLPMSGGWLTFVFSARIDDKPASRSLTNKARVYVNDAELVTNEVTTDIPDDEPGRLALAKSSSLQGITVGNPCYSLAGAKYSVHTDSQCRAASAVGTLVTNEEGASEPIELDAGTYYVKETAAPTGFARDDSIHRVEVTKGSTTVLEVGDDPLCDHVGVVVQKVDAGLGAASPQGGASLAEAEFQLSFYAGLYEADELPDEATRTWVLRTDEAGRATLSQTSLVSGDDLFLDQEGSPVLPLGTIAIRETKAPKGYRLAPTGQPVVRQVTIDAETGTVIGYVQPTVDDPTVREEPQRGALRVRKVDASTGEGLAGATFAVKNANDHPVKVGNAVVQPGKSLTIRSGEDGIATIDALPYGTYEVSESGAPYGYIRDASWKSRFTISKDHEVIDLTGEPAKNERIGTQVTLSGRKVFDGSARNLRLEAGMFSFALRDAGGDILQTTTNDAQGDFAFKPLGFGYQDLQREHVYTIVEIAGDEEGIVYDTHEEKVTIELSTNADGALSATVRTDRDGVVFRNSATDEGVTLPMTGQGGTRETQGGIVALLLAVALSILRRRTRGGIA